MQENGLIRKLRKIPKIMTSQAETEAITISILPGISKYKDNRTMKFGQLIELNVRNIFLQKIWQGD